MRNDPIVKRHAQRVGSSTTNSWRIAALFSYLKKLEAENAPPRQDGAETAINRTEGLVEEIVVIRLACAPSGRRCGVHLKLR